MMMMMMMEMRMVMAVMVVVMMIAIAYMSLTLFTDINHFNPYDDPLWALFSLILQMRIGRLREEEYFAPAIHYVKTIVGFGA